MRPSPAPLCAALLLAACSRGSDEPAPAPEPTLTSQPMPTANAAGEPLTPGSWRIEEAAGGASAAFVDQGGAVLVALLCNRNTGALELTRPGPAEGPQTWGIAVGNRRAALRMTPTAGQPPALEAELDPSQPIIVALLDPAESITLTAPGSAPLRLPGHSGMSRVIEACS